MPRIYHNNTSIDSVDSLLANFKGKSLRSPMRSTVPLLDMVLHAQSHLGRSIRCEEPRRCV
jgi:hypothetical protein